MPKQQNEIVVETDVLVIGGGWAGFFAAVKAKEDGANVTLVDKGFASRAGASSRNDGHFTVFNEEWGGKLETWQKQTAETGEYMNNPKWTEITCMESYARYQDMLAWGVVPPKSEEGELARLKSRAEGGIVAIWLGWGSETMPFVRKHALKIGIKIVDRVQITDLIKQNGRVCGAVGFGTQTGDFYIFNAKSTILCTGTSGFKTQVPAANAGNSSFDGEAMILRAGGEVSGMEFSCMARWKPFIVDYPDDAPVSPREGRQISDIYSRDISWLLGYRCPILLLGNYTDADGHGQGPFNFNSLMAVHEGKGPMMMDTEFVSQEEIDYSVLLRKPDYSRFEAVGADPVGRALYRGTFDLAESFLGRHCGGSGGVTATDYDGGTSLPGLFGAGDSYHTAVCGSVYSGGGTGIRVAAVTGARAGHTAAKYASGKDNISINDKEIARLREFALGPIERKGGFDPSWVADRIRGAIVPYYVFGVRSGPRLKAALTTLEFLEGHVSPLICARDAHDLAAAHDAKSRILGAKMMVASALYREESRGLQYREDFPYRDDKNWHCHVKIQQKDGRFVLSKIPIDEWWPDFASKLYLEKYPNRFRGEIIPE